VKRGLCERPDHWEWSSFRHYATGIEGRVEIESEWAARARTGSGETLSAGGPTPLKQGLNGPPVLVFRTIRSKQHSAPGLLPRGGSCARIYISTARPRPFSLSHKGENKAVSLAEACRPQPQPG
jgi:hypothetical protein